MELVLTLLVLNQLKLGLYLSCIADFTLILLLILLIINLIRVYISAMFRTL